MKNQFQPSSYWQKRHQKIDLSTVGYAGIGLAFNSWMYRVRKKVFIKSVSPYFLSHISSNILDLGSGSGFYINLWQDLDAQDITGSDFSQNAVNSLKKNFGDSKIIRLDITKSILPSLKGKFEIVSAMDILFHIVDDKKYEQTLQNINHLLKPRGILIFSENIPPKRNVLKHQVSRTKKEIFKILRQNNFKIKNIKPMFYLMNTPVGSQNPILRFYWKVLVGVLSRFNFLGYFFGPLLYPLELFLVNFSKTSPATQLLICQKVSD